MSTAIASGSSTPTCSEPRPRPGKRRLSSATRRRPPALQICQPLPHSVKDLVLRDASPIQALASVRVLVLSYLAELESQLTLVESPGLDSWRAKGEMTIDEASQLAHEALEMLNSIRTDVYSHLPDLHLTDMSAEVESFVKSHLPDLPCVSGLSAGITLEEMRSHLPDLPDVRTHLLDMSEISSHLPDFDFADMRTKLIDDMRTRFEQPLSYIPLLSRHLQELHSHLTSIEFPEVPDFAGGSMVHDLLDAILSSELVSDLMGAAPDVMEGEAMLETAAREVASAMKRSFEGVRLISYSDLPQQWRNNPFVRQGYRYARIPFEAIHIPNFRTDSYP